MYVYTLSIFYFPFAQTLKSSLKQLQHVSYSTYRSARSVVHGSDVRSTMSGLRGAGSVAQGAQSIVQVP